MKCFNHSDADATALCAGCNKGLCAPCTARLGGSLCEHCLVQRARVTTHSIYTELLTSAVLFAGTTWLFHKPQATHLPIASAAILGLLATFTYSGWQFLSRQFQIWWIGSGIVWLIYSTVKLVASFFIGVIVGPLRIMKSLVQLYSLQKLRRQLAMNRALSKSDRADEESSPNRARLI